MWFELWIQLYLNRLYFWTFSHVIPFSLRQFGLVFSHKKIKIIERDNWR